MVRFSIYVVSEMAGKDVVYREGRRGKVSAALELLGGNVRLKSIVRCALVGKNVLHVAVHTRSLDTAKEQDSETGRRYRHGREKKPYAINLICALPPLSSLLSRRRQAGIKIGRLKPSEASWRSLEYEDRWPINPPTHSEQLRDVESDACTVGCRLETESAQKVCTWLKGRSHRK